MRPFLFLILLFSLASGLRAQAPEASYIWPTNASPYLSSTFGETRSAHFHAGLDIKTWGQEGYEVYATRDGVLSRLLITNQGYGKAIYLRHPDSTYTVYAHLQRFARDFQGIADSSRLQSYTYETDLFLEKDGINVQKGDIIGYTGSTGIGPPHLHYEIRNKDNEPVNALLSNLKVEDTTPPIFSALMIEPQTPLTLIDDSLYPKVIRPQKVENGVYDFGEVGVSGEIGISANIFDMSDHVTNKYAAYELMLIHDQDTLYLERIDQFNFDQADNMFLNRAPEPFNDRRSFQRLYLKDGNDYPFLISRKELTEGSFNSPYTIIAKDIYGNTSQGVIRFVPEPASRELIQPSLLDYDLEILENSFWTENWVILSDSSFLDLKAPQQFFRTNASLKRITPELLTIQQTPDARLTTRYQPGTFFDTLSVLQYYRESEEGTQIHIAGKNLTARKSFGIQFYLGQTYEAPNQLHLYEIDDEGELSFVESWVSGTSLYAYPDQPGDFVVRRDSLPPAIEEPEVIILPDGRQSIRIRVQDELSGADHTSAVFTINGIRGIPEYDYETDEFTFYHPGVELRKDNEIYFEVKDKAGNRAQANFRR